MLHFILKYLPAILLFAFATMIIYAWGLLKAQQKPKEMAMLLYAKSERKVKKALRDRGTVSRADVEKIVKNITVGPFYSRQRLGVTDPKAFAKSMLDYMQQQGIVSVTYKDGKNFYRLNKEVKDRK